jgi:hypothetical protein
MRVSTELATLGADASTGSVGKEEADEPAAKRKGRVGSRSGVGTSLGDRRGHHGRRALTRSDGARRRLHAVVMRLLYPISSRIRRVAFRRSPSPLRWSRTHVAHKTEWHAQEVLVNGQLVQERERVVERLEQVLVVLDHLAAHVDAQPLLVAVQFVAIENVS